MEAVAKAEGIQRIKPIIRTPINEADETVNRLTYFMLKNIPNAESLRKMEHGEERPLSIGGSDWTLQVKKEEEIFLRRKIRIISLTRGKLEDKGKLRFGIITEEDCDTALGCFGNTISLSYGEPFNITEMKKNLKIGNEEGSKSPIQTNKTAPSEVPEEAKSPFSLKTLKRGEEINSGYSLAEVLALIKYLNVDTSIWTSQSEADLSINFESSTFPWDKELKDPELSFIIITGPLKRQTPTQSFMGSKRTWKPTEFIAALKLKEGTDKVKKISFDTRLSKPELVRLIESKYGFVPENWRFNSQSLKNLTLVR